jgi:aminobenzoyl-glutamate utilization protein B
VAPSKASIWYFFRETDYEHIKALWEIGDKKDMEYTPLLRAEDVPAIHLNRVIMATWRPQMKDYYYDPDEYDTYLEQLGVEYPTVRAKTSD